MNYHQYESIDVVNGPGTRCTLFVSGCVHQCRGCYNKSTWSLCSGHPFTESLEEQIIHDLSDTKIPRRGLSLSGGDPLHPENVSDILRIVLRVKAQCPTKDIWLWTGYCMNELTFEQKRVVDLIDVLIDGKFEKSQADPNLSWRGSANQIIYYMKA